MKVWSTKSNLNTARVYLAGGGTPNNSLAAGGRTTTSGGTLNTCENFNGTSWSNIANMSYVRWGFVLCGLSFNNMLAVNGDIDAYTNTTEYFNGTSWAASANTNVQRKYLGGAGEYNSTTIFGGYATLNTAESFDGVSWTNISNCLYGVRWVSGGGLSKNNIIKISGYNGSSYSNNERYNGVSWSTAENLNTPRGYMGGGGNSSGDGLVIFGGYNGGVLGSTEYHTGTAFAVGNSLNVSRYSLGGSVNTTTGDALSFGGYNLSTVLNTTEAYSEGAIPTWGHKILGISGIGKIIGINIANISKVGGV